MNKKTFILRNQSVLEYLIQYLRGIVLSETNPFAVTIGEVNRTLEQNSLLWPLLECFSQQLKWPVNGEMVYMEPEDWKHILSAAFKKENLRMALGINGGMILLGQRTSKMGKKEFSEFIEFILYVAAERGVNVERERKVA